MQVARLLLGLVAASHVVSVLTPWIGDGLQHRIAASRPDLDATAVTHAAHDSLVAAVALHAPLLVVSLALIRALPSGSPWARRPATVSQVLGAVFGVLLWSAPSTVREIVPLVVGTQIAIVVLLWWPTDSRAFFTATA